MILRKDEDGKWDRGKIVKLVLIQRGNAKRVRNASWFRSSDIDVNNVLIRGVVSHKSRLGMRVDPNWPNWYRFMRKNLSIVTPCNYLPALPPLALLNIVSSPSDTLCEQEQVTRGYNIVADGWAGVYSPLTHTHTHKWDISGVRLHTFQLVRCELTNGLTDGLMDKWSNEQTDKQNASYRAATLRLKRELFEHVTF